MPSFSFCAYMYTCISMCLECIICDFSEKKESRLSFPMGGVRFGYPASHPSRGITRFFFTLSITVYNPWFCFFDVTDIQVRPEFCGETRVSEVTGLPYIYYPSITRRFKQFLSVPILCIFLWIVFGFLWFSLWIESILEDPNPQSSHVCTVTLIINKNSLFCYDNSCVKY